MEQRTAHENEVLHEAMSLVQSAPPSPWRQVAFIAAGGVIAAGWTEDESILLVSHDGYSLTAADGRRLLRNREPSSLTPDNLAFALLGHSTPVRVFGAFGGEGSWLTTDGWRIEIVYPLWPRAWLIMRAPSGSGAKAVFAAVTRLELHGLDEHDWLRAGFSPSGNHALVVSASGCLVISRTPGGAT